MVNKLTSDILSAIMWVSDSESVSANKTAVEDDFETLLAHFACGWVTDAERMTVIEELSESEDYRLRLLQMRDSLKSVAWARMPANDPVLAKALTSSVRALVNAYSSWKQVCASVLAAEARSLDERRSIQSAMRRIDAAWKLQPSGSALTRGDAFVSKVSVQPGNIQAQLSSHVDLAGGAVFSAELSPSLETKMELSLYIIGPDGDWIFLGAAIAEGSHWQLAVNSIVELLGTTATDLQSSWLTLAVGTYLPKRNAVRLDRSTDGVDSSVWLATTNPPGMLAGEFSVSIDLPETIRAGLEGGAIVASIDLGSMRYPIGRWSVSDLPRTPQVTLNAPLGGVEDGEIELESAIRFSFVAADPHE